MKLIFNKESSNAIKKLAINLFGHLPPKEALKKTVAKSLALLKHINNFAGDDQEIIIINSKGARQKILLKD